MKPIHYISHRKHYVLVSVTFLLRINPWQSMCENPSQGLQNELSLLCKLNYNFCCLEHVNPQILCCIGNFCRKSQKEAFSALTCSQIRVSSIHKQLRWLVRQKAVPWGWATIWYISEKSNRDEWTIDKYAKAPTVSLFLCPQDEGCHSSRPMR